MIDPREFSAKIEAFLSQTGTTATRFGKEAVGDPSFVFDLRKGREPGYRTARRVLDYIREAGQQKSILPEQQKAS